MQYGNIWRTHRKLFHRFFNISAASQFDDKIHKAVSVFLHRLSDSPERFLKHAHLYVSFRSIIVCPELIVRILDGKPYWVFDAVDRVRGEHRV